MTLFERANRPRGRRAEATLREVAGAIGGGQYAAAVRAVRAETDPARRKALKLSTLPALAPSGVFTSRTAEGFVRHSGLVVIDLDHAPDLPTVRADVTARPYVALGFASPSGDGFKAAVPVAVVCPETGTRRPPQDEAEHKAAWVAVAARFETGETAGLVDPSGKDLARACYLSHDPNVFVNEHAEAVVVPLGKNVPPVRPPVPADRRARLEAALGTVGRAGRLAYPEWIKLVAAVLDATGGDAADAEALLVRYVGEETPGEYAEKLGRPLGRVTAGTLYHMAREAGWPDPWQREQPGVPVSGGPERRGAPGHRHASPPFVPFPTADLPAVAAAYVRAHAAALNVDEAAVAVPLLPALAAAVGNSYEAEVKPGWRERAAVWAVLVQPSGTLKSQAVQVAVAPALALEREANEAYLAARETCDVETERWNARSKTERASTPRPAAPVRERFRVGDATVESVGAVHADAPRGVLLYRDELSGWFGSFDKYSRGDADAANWIEMGGGRPVVIDRKSDERGVLYVERPNVSVVGTVQPATIASRLGPGHFASGFAARLLLTEPPVRPRRWSDASASPDVDAGYHGLVRALYAAPAGSGVLPFDDEARDVFRVFYDENGAVLDGLPDGPLRASVSKVEGYAARLALVFHLCACAARDPGPITADAVRRAVTVARWLRGEQARVYRLHGFDRRALDDDARRVLLLPDEFAWQNVAEVWSVTKSAAFKVIARLVGKALVEAVAHGRYRRASAWTGDFGDSGPVEVSSVSKVSRPRVPSDATPSPGVYTPTEPQGDGVPTGHPVPTAAGRDPGGEHRRHEADPF